MRRVRRLLALSPADRVLLARAFVHVAAIRLGLWVLPFRLFRGVLGTQCDPRSSLAALATLRSDSSPEPREVQVERLAWAVRTAAPFVPRASCLTQALALHRLLQRAGQASVLNIGILRDPDGGHGGDAELASARTGGGAGLQIRSHAWVERGGRCWLITPSEAERFTPLVRWGLP